MFALQLALSGLAWAGLIAMLFLRREGLIARMWRLSRKRRFAQAAACLGLSVVVLAVILAALSHGGLGAGAFSLWGWLLTTALGAAFVALQTTALVPLVLNAATPVTPETAQSSDRLDDHRP